MKGFFSKEQTKSASRPDGKSYSCASCGLYQHKLHPRMESFGKGKKGILNIGEAPGQTEDEKGKQWQGKAGRILQRVYRRLGIDLFEDCRSIDSANCRPTDENGNNRPPTPFEIACCRKRVFQAIEEFKPKLIVLFGNSPVISFIGSRWKKDLGGIGKWRGYAIPDRESRAWVCPTFHPSFVERSEKDPVVEVIWEADLENALKCLDKPFPVFQDEREQVEIISDLSPLTEIQDGIVCLDYETTGLKPYLEGHRIVTAAIADSDEHAFAFVLPESRREQFPFIRLLKNPNVQKVVHNSKFEQIWTELILGFPIVGLEWCSMNTAHILDNREGATGLKFQTYINFGVPDYDSSVSPYLKATDRKRGANSSNRIMEAMSDPKKRRELLIYNGMDTIFGRRLALKQMEESLH